MFPTERNSLCTILLHFPRLFARLPAIYTLYGPQNMASSGKARLLYSPQKLGKNNTKKAQNAVKDFGKLLGRLKTEGATKWMKNAIMMAKTKLNKYGYNDAKLKEMFAFDAKTALSDAAPKAAKKTAPKTAKAEVADKPAKAPAKKPAAKKAAPKKEESAE